jgi:RNA polymerase sigma factor (sigma-70 family)
MEKPFLDMINAHRGILYKVCNMYCDDHEDRKDLFQEIVLQLWRSYGSFRNESMLSTWMYRVALNTAISNFRKEKRRPGSQPISLTDFQIPDLDEFSKETENLALLKDAINQLTQIEKALIMLYLDEKSYDEIGEIMGITRTNVGARIHRIKIKLEVIIKKASL